MDASGPAAGLDGELLGPGEPGFDEARRMWNGRFDPRPALIARCASDTDVAAAITLARDRGLRLSVKGGGHNYAGKSVGGDGLLLDLSPMKGIDLDPADRRVTVQGGVTCGELDAATQAHGLATPLPTVSSVGVIGAALGGGSGYLSRKHGLTLDNVRSAIVVTADGRHLRAAADEYPELFWALRGGGGNFGVVTALELALHPVGPTVFSGQVVYPLAGAGEHLRFFRDFMAGAPEELQCYPFFFRVPPLDVFPAETHGSPVIDFVFCHQDPAAGYVVRPLRELGDPVLDVAGETAYVDTQQAFDANLPKGARYLSKAHNLTALSDGVIATILEHVPGMTGDLTSAYLDPQGGAVGRIDVPATPFAGRDAGYGFHIIAGWTDAGDDGTVGAWATGLHDAMAAHATGGVYVSLIGDDEPGRVPAAYGPNYGRLVELKRRWDPDNVFAGNYNIPPG